jgi:cellulose synthase/poly-beta-1,6-N-acetylglucosamine synthase-like glycosyltransferase
MTGPAAVVAASLTCFSVRRLVLLVGALLPRRELAGARGELPSVTLVVAARNEASCIDPLLDALAALDYPAGRLSTVLVDDCSDDATAERLTDWAADRPGALALHLPAPVGKYRAQNAGIAAADGELVVACDADLRPRRECVRRLAQAFVDETVGAAAAFLSPDNAERSGVARYAAVESWVHQLVTSAGKDRLDLNPPALGGCCAYRRVALEGVGRFRSEPGEDVRVTVALTRAGWRTRFVPQALADNAVVHRWVDYWHQHIRWARNLFAAAGGRARVRGSVPLGRRIEAWMLSVGYADRLALLAALPLTAAGRLPFRFPAFYLAVVASEVGAALAKARVARHAHRFLFWTAAFFALDVMASLAATLAHLGRRPRTWRHPRMHRHVARDTGPRAAEKVS